MRRLGCLFLALVLALPVWGEPAHKLLLAFQGNDRPKYVSALVASLANELRGLPVVVSTLDAPTVESASREARQRVCDVLLLISITDENGRDRVVWTLSSPQETEARAGGSVVKPRPDWPAAADVYWVFLSPFLDRELGADARPWPAPPVSERAAFIVTAQPNTLVLGLPNGPATIDETGTLSVEVDLPVSVLLEGRLLGSRTTPQRVFIHEPGQTVPMEQRREPEWTFTSGMANFAFPYAGVEWNLPGSRLTVRGSLDPYLAGVTFQDHDSWFVSLPLVSVSAGASWMWSWPDDQVRFYTAADVGVRFMAPQAKVFSIDPIVPVTLLPVVGWEYRWAPPHALYLELGPTISLLLDVPSYLASIPAHSESLHVVMGPLAIDFPFQTKVGYRWAF